MFTNLVTILVSIPTKGTVRAETVSWILHNLNSKNYRMIVNFMIDSNIIDVIRNKQVDNFLKTNFDYILFLDSDIIPPSDILDEMLRVDKDILTGIYNMNDGGKIKECIFFYDDETKIYRQKNISQSNSELVEVDGCGAGFLLVKRCVFEKLEDPYFETLYSKRGEMVLSEDLNFCRKVKENGFKIYAYTKCLCGHVKDVLI